MANKIQAEVNVLDRIMHLLEEGSVSHLIEDDNAFASFIENLYSTVNSKAGELLTN